MTRRCWKVALGALGFCVSASFAAASADPRFIVSRFDTDQGLPESSVVAMTQTPDGYLWVGTLNGLARFDGLRFTCFAEDELPGVANGRILKLFADSQTNLWVGTENAGVFLVTRAGKVVRVTIQPGPAQGLLMAACEDTQGAVWLHTADIGTEALTGRLVRYRAGRLESWPSLPSRHRALIADEAGLVWVGTDGSQTALRPSSNAPPAGLPPVVARLQGAGMDYLLASKGGGYWRLAGGRIQKCLNTQVTRDLGAYPWAPSVIVTAACEDSLGNLVVGTYGAGLYWFDPEGKPTRISSEQGLSHASVLSLCVDHEGSIWVGTDGGGLDRLKRQVFGVLDGSVGSVVQSVARDGRGGLWIGYNGERIDHWDGQDLARYTNILHDSPDLRNLGLVFLRSVFVDRDQNVWAGTKDHGLFKLEDGHFRPAPGSRSISRHISAIHQDRQGTLWVGTEAGLARWDGKEWTTSCVTNGLSADSVLAIADDPDGNLWVGTDGGGLDHLVKGRFSRLGKSTGLPGDRVSSLLVDRAGVLWAGTSGGLAWLDSGKWNRFTAEEGLPIGGVGYLVDDEQGDLWLGSNGGLIRVSKKALADLAGGLIHTVAVRVYSKADGLPTSECTFGSQPAACRTEDGELWFPTIRGLVSLNPAQLRPNTNPPPVVIESAWIEGRAVHTNHWCSVPLASVVLPPGKEGLELHFTSLNLAAADRARFSYKMEPYEQDWSPPNDARFARYGHLPPGDYVFHLKASNEDGLWSQTPVTLAVTVLPLFWQTRWFLALVVLVLLGIVGGSIYYISTQKFVRQLAVLRHHEALAQERARIARDLHDQLGANLTQVALLGEMAEADKNLPQDVELHARQISQTARDTTRALDEIVWTVNPANDTLDGLINYVCKDAQEFLALAGLRYRLEVPSQLPAIRISPELRHNVFLVAKEAVNNLVKHAQASSAWLRLRIEPGRFVLEIEDDGRGLSPGDAHKGRNGLLNMRQRMEDVGGNLSFLPRPGGGTTICLTAPLDEIQPHGPP